VTTASSGLVLIDKPAGLTSQQAVVRVRKALGAQRAGHTGTLDPFATGLLIVLVGRATRLAPYVADDPKEYEALFHFGAETDTDDATGTVLRTASTPSERAVTSAITELTGDLEQVPPAFSAKHVDGERAYALARRGVRTELRPVRVRVDRWDVLAQTSDAIRVRITCSGGTYIRALARDLGRLTTSAAHCAELRRVRCGPFQVEDAILPEAASAADVRPPLAAVPELPTEHLDAAAALGVAHGRPADATVAGEWAALVNHDAQLIAIAQRAENLWLPRVVLSSS
jgi:tRNA pseudouridine55 synthase